MLHCFFFLIIFFYGLRLVNSTSDVLKVIYPHLTSTNGVFKTALALQDLGEGVSRYTILVKWLKRIGILLISF